MTKTVMVQAALQLFALPGHGTFEVGVDIKAGTHISAAPVSDLRKQGWEGRVDVAFSDETRRL
jgi:hypothetical protein